jgi:hypothetical protein
MEKSDFSAELSGLTSRYAALVCKTKLIPVKSNRPAVTGLAALVKKRKEWPSQ